MPKPEVDSPVYVFCGASGAPPACPLPSDGLQLTYICEDLLRKNGFFQRFERLLLLLVTAVVELTQAAARRCRLLFRAGMEAQMRPSDPSTTVRAKAQRAAQVVS